MLVGLNKRIEFLEDENKSLKTESEKLKERVSNLELASDEQEQYSRRNSLRIRDVKENEGEDTDKIVVDLCNSSLV